MLTLAQTLLTLLKSPTFFDENRITVPRYNESLVFTCFHELLRNIHQTVFLSGCCLYKSAYHNIRCALEFIVQSYYIDVKCPEDDFSARIKVLRKIENDRNYRGNALVDKLNLPSEIRESVRMQYKQLSKKVHSTAKQFVYTANNYMNDKYKSVYFDANELKEIRKASVRVVDFFYYLFITRFPELTKSLLENDEFVDSAEIIDMPLLFDKLLGTTEYNKVP